MKKQKEDHFFYQKREQHVRWNIIKYYIHVTYTIFS